MHQQRMILSKGITYMFGCYIYIHDHDIRKDTLRSKIIIVIIDVCGDRCI